MLKIAFAGFRHGHINGLYMQAVENPEVEIVGAFEADDAARTAVAESLGVNFNYDCYDKLLAESGADVIAIGDYFGIRGSRAIAALKAGKHVIADKPLCTSLAELDEIEKLSAEKGLKVGCMLDLRLSAWVQPVRNFILEGKLGEVHNICFTAQHPLNYGTRASWYFEDGKQGGTINDIAIHGIDIIPYLTGLKFAKINAARCWNAFATKEPNFKDAGMFMVEMSNGAGLMADVTYAAPSSCGFKLPYYWRFTIWGEKGVMEFGGNLDPQITVALEGGDGPIILPVDDAPRGKILDYFMDELAGKATDLNTAVVLESSRVALEIQAAADRA
ncbi:MAG: Gfo/Idh/MocA family oxidoreductase [Ruminococcaceae bacterium]|nr:Gfo/Idh/MocA family oxidoreductase [Oscillospiraceae bacterium]